MSDSGGELPKNKELETAMLCVNGREFLVRLDWARRNIPNESNAWTFITGLAYTNPSKFMSYVDEYSQELFEWDEIDEILKNGINSGSATSGKIQAIKRYREITCTGVKEAKEAVVKRIRALGIIS